MSKRAFLYFSRSSTWRVSKLAAATAAGELCISCRAAAIARPYNQLESYAVFRLTDTECAWRGDADTVVCSPVAARWSRQSCRGSASASLHHHNHSPQHNTTVLQCTVCPLLPLQFITVAYIKVISTKNSHSNKLLQWVFFGTYNYDF